MANSADPAIDATDPRILRSRHMLMDALSKLLAKKDFDEISVQEIADESTLNRATFYLHYPDKNALLQAFADLRFRDLIARRGIKFSTCDGALRAIALGVCDYLTEITTCPAKGSQIPLERSIVPVIEAMFLEGLSHRRLKPGTDASLLATTAAWAVFGAASRWFQTADRIPAEDIAKKIESIVTPIFPSATEKSYSPAGM